MAHETVHLLNPVAGNTNNLEEASPLPSRCTSNPPTGSTSDQAQPHTTILTIWYPGYREARSRPADAFVARSEPPA